MKRTGERVSHDLELWLCVLLREAPDLASRGDRRVVVEVHLGGKVAGSSLVGAGNHEAALSVIAEARAVRHADELVVDDDEVLAIDEAVRPVWVARACRRYRRQVEDLLSLHCMYLLIARCV